MEESLFTATPDQEEERLFTTLRADSWDNFLGQELIKESLQVTMTAAKKREEALEHVLFYGPPGLGKTTLAHLIAKEMGTNIRMTSGPAIERSGDLAAILTNLEKGDILFIDEIHRLRTPIEETLYSAMEDYALDIVVGKGPSARTLRIDLPQFTLVGATTKAGNLSGPLRDRFGVVHRLHFYSEREIGQILSRAAEKLQIKIDQSSLSALASRSRGTPRIALRLLKRVRDMAQVHDKNSIDDDITLKALSLLSVDEKGLEDLDRRYLEMMISSYKGGPVGVETLAASLSEDIGTLEEVVEPYLLQIGFLQKTPRGRLVTESAYGHLHMLKAS